MSKFTELNEAELGTVAGGGDADPCPLSYAATPEFYPLLPTEPAIPAS